MDDLVHNFTKPLSVGMAVGGAALIWAANQLGAVFGRVDIGAVAAGLAGALTIVGGAGVAIYRSIRGAQIQMEKQRADTALAIAQAEHEAKVKWDKESAELLGPQLEKLRKSQHEMNNKMQQMQDRHDEEVGRLEHLLDDARKMLSDQMADNARIRLELATTNDLLNGQRKENSRLMTLMVDNKQRIDHLESGAEVSQAGHEDNSHRLDALEGEAKSST